MSPRRPSLNLTGKRLVIVGGKGGVGRTTVAAALAVAAGRHGLQTLIVEVGGRRDVARLLGEEGGADLSETPLQPNLFHVSIERRAALEDYLRHEVPGPLPAGRLARNRAFSTFVDATPGMEDLLSIGKVWELTRRRRGRRGPRSYDLVVLDAPASGQLLALLQAPTTFGSIARVGPIARQTANIEQLLKDPELTAVLCVATPEQLAVTETLVLHRAVGRTLGEDLAAVILNKTLSVPFKRAEEELLKGPDGDPAISSALWLCERGRSQRRHVDRLRRELGHVPRVNLPFLFDDLASAGVEQLAKRLGPALA